MVGDVGDPLLVRPRRRKVALEQVARPLDRRLIRDRCPLALAAADAFQAFLAHHPGDAVAADLDAATLQLLPGLADAVDAPVPLAGGVDLRDQPLVLAAGKVCLEVAERARRRDRGPVLWLRLGIVSPEA